MNLKGVRLDEKAKTLIERIKENPFQNPRHTRRLSEIYRAYIPGESTYSTGWFIRCMMILLKWMASHMRER